MAGLVPAIHALLAALWEKKDVDARHKAGHDGLLLCWRVTLRRLLHQSQRVAVRVGEERHPQIVVIHLGDQMRLAAESHAALLELAYRKRNIGATKVDDRA